MCLCGRSVLGFVLSHSQFPKNEIWISKIVLAYSQGWYVFMFGRGEGERGGEKKGEEGRETERRKEGVKGREGGRRGEERRREGGRREEREGREGGEERKRSGRGEGERKYVQRCTSLCSHAT